MTRIVPPSPDPKDAPEYAHRIRELREEVSNSRKFAQKKRGRDRRPAEATQAAPMADARSTASAPPPRPHVRPPQKRPVQRKQPVANQLQVSEIKVVATAALTSLIVSTVAALLVVDVAAGLDLAASISGILTSVLGWSL